LDGGEMKLELGTFGVENKRNDLLSLNFIE
jgi:hypothetical protein